MYASTGTINTSDRNDKISKPFSEAERRVATRLRSLVSLYQWKESVATKGADSARVHAGVMAQDVAAAFRAEGLEPDKYGVWCSDELSEEVVVESDQDIDVPITEEVTLEQQEVRIIEGKAVMVNTSRTEIRNKLAKLPVFDLDGAPVMVSRPASAGGPYQMIHEFPLTRRQSVKIKTSERKVVGTRLGLRYDELFAWIIAGLAS